MMLAPRITRIRIISRTILFVAAVCGFCWVTGYPRTWDDDELNVPSDSASPHHVETDQLVVSVRTTATDAFAKVPPLLLLTNPMYHDTLLLMGDLQMDIGAFHVHDVLDRLDGQLKMSNPELARYRRQVSYALASIDIGIAKGETDEEEKATMAKLDKYKMLRMLERAWDLKPDRNWYAFVDTETYLVRPNLYSWLGQYDPSTSIFFANPPNLVATDPYGLSGNTFILSGKAMHSLFADGERGSDMVLWDARASEYKSSFDTLYSALHTSLNVQVNTTWPLISGFHPGTMPFGPGLWCEQVLAMHSVPTDLMSDIWRLERDRIENQHNRDPLLFADLWTRFLSPENLDTPRLDWDNLSSGPENARWNILFEGVEPLPATSRHQARDNIGQAANGEASWEACQASCEAIEHCVQWSYSSVPMPNYNENGETKCHLSRSMRFGSHVGPLDVLQNGVSLERKWRSGWRKENFETWARRQRCKGQQN